MYNTSCVFANTAVMGPGGNSMFKDFREFNMEKKLFLDRLFSFYGELLSDGQKEACRLYLDEDLSIGEIAAHLSVTRQGVYDTLNRAFSKLDDFEKKLELCSRFDAVQRELVALKEEMRQLVPETGSRDTYEKCLLRLDALTQIEDQE
ncbi:MAG: RNA polymerase subunit sigma-70 [Clostridiales bacterium]|nr:RNA polymerase subunit sigma-70 [Clostridiales bacterium]